MFWEKPTEFPPMALEQWRNRFHIALLAKHDIDTEDIQDYIPRPTFDFTPEEASAVQRETREAETARNERNKQAKETADIKLKDQMKKWNELRVGGLDDAAANRKA